jgi:chromosome segregation ATPase
MSDIESDEYEIMDVPELPGTEASVIDECDTDQESTPSPKSILPHSVLCKYTIRDIVESPNTSYTFSTSEYCDNILNLTGEVDGRECPGFTRFTLRNKNWVSNAKMELTLTLNNTKNSKNVADSSLLAFENGLPNGVSVETDDIDEENTNFRVITFTYSKNEHFAIKTDLAYSWTLRTLNDSEFNVELTYEPDFFQIIKNLKNNELKSASKRRFNTALQKIYVEQLKKDGNYYCEELKTAKDHIHNLNIDLHETREQVEDIASECESAYLCKKSALIKQRSSLDEIKDLKGKLNRMTFLKEFYICETKIAKDKREFAEKQLKEIEVERDELQEERDELQEERDELQEERDELQEERDELQEERDELQAERDELEVERDELQAERDELEVELNGSRIKYDKIKRRYNELEVEFDGLDAELEEVRRRNDELREDLALAEEQYSDDSVDSVELEELKSRNDELEEKLELMVEIQVAHEQTIDTQTSTIKSMELISKDLTVYKDLAKKYKTNLELKERDIENLEDLVNEYKNELNKPIKYRENVKSLKADNSYLKAEVGRLKREYKKLNNQSNHTKWSNEDIVKNLKNEIVYLKRKRINKTKIENDINDFHKRGSDMLNWYTNNRNNHTNEFIQFQNETEFLFNDVLNYFKKTLILHKNNINEQA